MTREESSTQHVQVGENATGDEASGEEGREREVVSKRDDSNQTKFYQF